MESVAKRVVHGVCGLIAGGLLGVSLWMWGPFVHGWICVPVAMVVAGGMAAAFGDNFWENFLYGAAWW